MSKLKNKNLLITGGTAGIGRLMGQLALEKGVANLIVWGSSEKNMEATRQIFSKYSNVHYFKVDISQEEAISQAAEAVREAVGTIHLLINNAGIVAGDFFHQQNKDEIERVMEVNTLGTLRVTHAFLPCMIAHQEGHICTIASAAGMLGTPQMAVYSASKWALIGWSESLWLEMKQLKSRVQVSTVTPYYISTGMFEGVKSPLIPIVKPEKAASRIIRGIERNHRYIRIPGIIYLLPPMKGILPASWFDFIVGKIFGIYKSMNTFKGHQK